MKKYDGQTFLILAILAAALVVVYMVLSRQDGDAQNECTSAGGRVAHVHGGRGGWVCL